MTINDKLAARLRARLEAAVKAFGQAHGLPPIAVKGMTSWPEPDGDWCVQIRLRVEEESEAPQSSSP